MTAPVARARRPLRRARSPRSTRSRRRSRASRATTPSSPTTPPTAIAERSRARRADAAPSLAAETSRHRRASGSPPRCCATLPRGRHRARRGRRGAARRCGHRQPGLGRSASASTSCRATRGATGRRSPPARRRCRRRSTACAAALTRGRRPTASSRRAARPWRARSRPTRGAASRTTRAPFFLALVDEYDARRRRATPRSGRRLEDAAGRATAAYASLGRYLVEEYLPHADRARRGRRRALRAAGRGVQRHRPRPARDLRVGLGRAAPHRARDGRGRRAHPAGRADAAR